MGTTLEFSDGLALRVNPIQAGPATRYAYGAAEGSNVLMFYVTITNDTQSPYDPSQAVIDLTYDGLSAPRVFDSSHEDMAFANGSFEGFIDTRHHSTAGWLFAIPETQMDDMRMRVDLDPHRAPSYFSGSFSPPQDLPATN